MINHWRLLLVMPAALSKKMSKKYLSFYILYLTKSLLEKKERKEKKKLNLTYNQVSLLSGLLWPSRHLSSDEP